MNRTPSAALLAILACSTAALAQTAYDVIDLGTLAMQSNAAAINNFNQVVGASVAANSSYYATSFDPSGASAFAPFPGYRNSGATALTDSGVAYGVAYNLGSLSPVALRFDSTGPVSLGTFTPLGARQDGMLIGHAPRWDAGLCHEIACSFSGGTLTLLPTLGGASSHAFDVDSAGRIVGSSSLAANGDPKPALWINNVVSNLQTLGGPRGQAKGINDSGVVVGFSENSAGLALPTRWTISPTGTVLSRVELISPFPARPGNANDVNASGVAVGTVGFHAVRWLPDGTSIDLNSFRSPLSGWTLDVATAINNQGTIVGTGTLLGFPRAFMLVPVACSADFNRDGVLDFFDYLDFVDAFAGNRIASDYNLDGIIDFFDYLDFVDAFSHGC